MCILANGPRCCLAKPWNVMEWLLSSFILQSAIPILQHFGLCRRRGRRLGSLCVSASSHVEDMPTNDATKPTEGHRRCRQRLFLFVDSITAGQQTRLDFITNLLLSGSGCLHSYTPRAVRHHHAMCALTRNNVSQFPQKKRKEVTSITSTQCWT